MESTPAAAILDDEWPPGFRFHPTDQELVMYYLKRKICRGKLKLDVVAELDIYKWEPEDLPGLSLLKNGDRQWFFFSPRDRKYPNGSRANRATRQGYWKATGKDRNITCNSRDVGIKKTLVFYRGRAPSGLRTDWVMHEYLLEEAELKRCQNVHGYYAIYKLFKKSGPGPKNGEQYGAPFREEDWADDDFTKHTSNCDQINNRQLDDVSPADTCRNAQVDPSATNVDDRLNCIVGGHAPWPVNLDESLNCIVDDCAPSLINIRQLDNVSPADSCRNAQVDPSVTDVDERLNCIVDDRALSPVNFDDFDQALSQFLGEENHSTIIDASFENVGHAQPCSTFSQGAQQNLETSCSVGHSWDAHEATSSARPECVPETSGVHPEFLHPLFAENDFLEMDDLLGPQSVQDLPVQAPPIQFQATGDIFPDNAQFREDDGFDLYYDAGLFLGDLAPHDQTVHPAQYQMSQEDGSVNQVGLYPNAVTSVGNEMWNYDTTTYLHNSTVAYTRTMPLPTTGVVYAGVSASITTESNQNQIGKQAEGAQPWFSSTLWSLVESIPAAPASAAESAIVSKAFHRMSSFSRVRINSKSTIVTAGSASESARPGVGGRMKGFFFLSFLAAIFAIIFMYIGSNSNFSRT